MPKEILGVTMYNIKEVAELLSVTTKTIQNYIRAAASRGRRSAAGGTSQKKC